MYDKSWQNENSKMPQLGHGTTFECGITGKINQLN